MSGRLLLRLLLVLVAYLIGSIPVAYLLGRRHGVDVRTAGSRTAGASNVWMLTGRRTGVLAFTLDTFKALAPVTLARLARVDDRTVAAMAVAEVVGHNWPLWLGFNGGRGVIVSLATSWVLAPLPLFLPFALFIGGGRLLLRDTAPGVLATAVAFPLLAARMPRLLWAQQDRAATVVAGLAMLAVLALRRLTAAPLPTPGKAEASLWLSRLVFDRDAPGAAARPWRPKAGG